jgi:hypothetical protein
MIEVGGLLWGTLDPRFFCIRAIFGLLRYLW